MVMNNRRIQAIITEPGQSVKQEASSRLSVAM
jgi:hypothetical protein